jgi:5-hydroxyisourate hydrolase-like protein (transthyretin family)
LLIEPLEDRRLLTGMVSGVKWNDLDNDQTRDAGEPGLGGVQIYADTNPNGRFDQGEPAMFTGPDGTYQLTLTPRAEPYTIRETVPDGWVQTAPASLSHSVTVLNGVTVTGCDFGNHLPTSTVMGVKWNDVDHNGVRDPAEPGLSGVQIYVDTDNNGQYDAGETAVFTAIDGSYRLSLAPGEYVIRETVATAWMQTAPADGYYRLTTRDGQTTSGIDFGNSQNVGLVTGVKWEDANHNTERDAGESGVGGVQIYADLDGNGQYDTGEPATFTAPDGTYRLLLDAAATYMIRETVSDGWLQTAPVVGYHTADVASGGTVAGCDFGNAIVGAVVGTKWDDLNNNHRRDPGEPGLGGVQIYADLDGNAQCDAGEPATFSAPDGSYRLLLAPGTYTVRETLEANWTCTSPADGSYTFDVTAGATVTGIDFGNHLSVGTVTGAKWDDLNHDGVFDPGEPGLGGLQIYIDVDGNRQYDAGEPATFTAPDGTYRLTLAPGTYTIRETLQDDYVQTAPLAGFYEIDLIDGGTVADCDFGNWRGGAVTGVKWEDLNHNHARDPGEAGLGGVQIYADLDDNAKCDAGEPATFTAPDGTYRILLPDGDYTIRETVPRAWFQTAPLDGAYAIEINDGETVTDCDFGNWGGSSVEGVKWNDLNNNHDRDSGEPGLGGVQIYADLDGNAKCDAGEPAVFTAPDGSYRLLLDPGTYTVRETLEENWTCTAPADGSYTFVLAAGTTVTGIDFGNHQLLATVTGIKWDDLNHDGLRDPGEPGRGGFQIYVDTDNNGRYDAGETGVFTAPDGTYRMLLAPGEYVLRETDEPGWVCTTPTTGYYEMELDDGDTVDDLDFGNCNTVGAVTGVKWEDLNHNAQRDPGEAGLGGWQIYADMNANQKCDAGEPAVFTAPDGSYRLLLDAGTYTVRETLTAGWVQAAPTDGQYQEAIAAGATLTGRDFGNYPNLATVVGAKWNDLNGNGDRDPGEPGLGGVQIYLDRDNNGLYDAGEPAVFTAPDGSYQLIVEPGNYFLRETVPAGWYQTFPASGFHAIALDPGDTLTCDFGNRDGLVTGSVWNDANGDGQRDPGEAGLPDWQIYADANHNGRFDAGEPHAWTAADGSYALALADGNHVLRETVPSGWLQTAPAGGSYAITVLTGVTLADRDFGNRAVAPGNATAAPSLYDPAASVWYLRRSNSSGAANHVFGYGQPGAGWLPVAGDWDGNGTDSIGLYDPDSSLWYLRNSNSAGQADYLFGYGPGQSDWIPVVGDWDGNGTRTVGLYDPQASTWYLRNANTSGNAEIVFGFGQPGAGWIPVVGDWNGDGIETVGLYDPSASTWYLSNANATAAPAALFGYGQPGGGWTPIAGDWDATAGASVGLVDPQCTWSLRDSNTSGMAELVFGYGPAQAGWIPLAGDWGTSGAALSVPDLSASDCPTAALAMAQLRPILDEAVQRYAAVGLACATLSGVQVAIADLPGTILGWATDATIVLDVDAAGHGWFVDPTPAADEEFVAAGGRSSVALDPAAVDRIDLLTVVQHELGHVAGLEDLESNDGLMSATLPVGLRRTVGTAEFDAALAAGAF